MTRLTRADARRKRREAHWAERAATHGRLAAAVDRLRTACTHLPPAKAEAVIDDVAGLVERRAEEVERHD
jgi:hypothetical protein